MTIAPRRRRRGAFYLEKPIMTVQSFRDLLTAQPFKPFRLVMSSGKTYEVRHPEMAFLTRTSIYVAVDIADDGVPNDYRLCSLLHVTAVEPVSATADSK